MAMAAKFALSHIKFAAVSLDRRHRNKSIKGRPYTFP
jgi:hypothetical protein